MMIREGLRKVIQASRFTAADRQAIARCVFEAESRTAAEIVTLVVPASGSYRDVDYLTGILLAAGTFFAAPQLPFLAVAFGLGAFFSSTLGPRGPRRWLTTAARRHRQVETAARSAFVDQGLAGAPTRAEVLLFYSELEHDAVLLSLSVPGLQGQLDEHVTPAQALGGMIRRLGVSLERAMPPGLAR